MTEPGARASRVQEGCRSSQRFHPQPLLPPPAAARSPWPPRVAGPAKRKRTASLGRDFTSRVLCGAFLATLVRLSSSDLSACCTSDNKQALGRHNVCVCVSGVKPSAHCSPSPVLSPVPKPKMQLDASKPQIFASRANSSRHLQHPGAEPHWRCARLCRRQTYPHPDILSEKGSRQIEARCSQQQALKQRLNAGVENVLGRHKMVNYRQVGKFNFHPTDDSVPPVRSLTGRRWVRAVRLQ